MGLFLRSSFLKNNGIILYILHITKVNGAENIQVVMTIIQIGLFDPVCIFRLIIAGP